MVAAICFDRVFVVWVLSIIDGGLNVQWGGGGLSPCLINPCTSRDWRCAIVRRINQLSADSDGTPAIYALGVKYVTTWWLSLPIECDAERKNTALSTLLTTQLQLVYKVPFERRTVFRMIAGQEREIGNCTNWTDNRELIECAVRDRPSLESWLFYFENKLYT